MVVPGGQYTYEIDARDSAGGRLDVGAATREPAADQHHAGAGSDGNVIRRPAARSGIEYLHFPNDAS
jgi:hypothetical protein